MGFSQHADMCSIVILTESGELSQVQAGWGRWCVEGGALGGVSLVGVLPSRLYSKCNEPPPRSPFIG